MNVTNKDSADQQLFPLHLSNGQKKAGRIVHPARLFIHYESQSVCSRSWKGEPRTILRPEKQ
jgi:hypothetical protein